MSARLPSTQALQCFEASARLGSFTAAGQELNLTQGGVSRQLQTLERLLGAQLLDRTASGLKLTLVGQQYLDAVLPALRAIESAGADLQAQRGQASVLNLSIPASWGNYWLIPRLSSLAQQSSKLNVNLFTKVGQADFSNRLIDAAIEFHRADPSEPLIHEFVMPLQLRPYASPEWFKRYGRQWEQGSIDAGQLLQHTTLPNAWSAWQEKAKRKHTIQASGSRFDLMFMCMHAAVGSSGVALLPAFMTLQLVRSRQLKALSPIAWQSAGGYYLRASPLLRNSIALRNFSQWLKMQAAS
jgi:LysR family transcriptional regulator, glycine cleavage system transcriptional activator